MHNVFYALLVNVSITSVGISSLCEGMLVMFVFLFSFAVDEDMLLALAHQKYKAGNYKQALEHSNAVYERNPRRTDNLLLLGAIHYQVFSSLLYTLCNTSIAPSIFIST